MFDFPVILFILLYCRILISLAVPLRSGWWESEISKEAEGERDVRGMRSREELWEYEASPPCRSRAATNVLSEPYDQSPELWSILTTFIQLSLSAHRLSPSLALRPPRNDDDDDGDCGARVTSLPLRLYRRELLNQAFSSRPRGGLLPMILGSPCSAGCHPNMSGKTAAFVICQRDRCGFHTHTENIL